jgi:GGDEF domain-containing protein
VTYNGEAIQVTVSAGFAVAESGVPAEYEQMKHIAAAALVEAKARGRNQCVICNLTASSEPLCHSPAEG